jgi:hypothetical protein
MKFILQQKKGQKLLLKIRVRYILICLLLFGIIFSACEKKEVKPVSYVVSADSALKIDKAILANYAQKVLGEKIVVFDYGIYEADSSKGLVVGKDFNTPEEWGIKFYYFKFVNHEPKQIYATDLLKGSFNESLVRKIKMINYNYEMIYYDSQDYFMGSGGGEVFIYIIDLNARISYYAHFFTTPEKPVSLFLSGNVTKPEIKEFLIKHFQKDYPGLLVVNKDADLDKGL